MKHSSEIGGDPTPLCKGICLWTLLHSSFQKIDDLPSHIAQGDYRNTLPTVHRGINRETNNKKLTTPTKEHAYKLSFIRVFKKMAIWPHASPTVSTATPYLNYTLPVIGKRQPRNSHNPDMQMNMLMNSRSLRFYKNWLSGLTHHPRWVQQCTTHSIPYCSKGHD